MGLVTVDSFNDGLFGWKNTVSGVLTRIGSGGRNGNGLHHLYSTSSSDTGSVSYVSTADKSTEFYIGFAYMPKMFIYNGYTLPIMDVRGDSAATTHLQFRRYGQNSMQVLRGSAGTVLGTISDAFPSINKWTYWEFYVKLSDAAGAVTVLRDGKVALQLTSVDTKNAGTDANFDSIVFAPTYTTIESSNTSAAGGSTATFDPIAILSDFYWCNASGSINNTFLGDVTVQARVPNGNGTYSDLTGSDGNSTNNFQLVRSKTGPDTGRYVTSDSTGVKDTYSTENVSTGSTIFGVMQRTINRKVGASTRNIRGVAVHNNTATPTAYYGSDLALTTSYAANSIRWETNPATSALWTAADYNAAEFGVEIRP